MNKKKLKKTKESILLFGIGTVSKENLISLLELAEDAVELAEMYENTPLKTLGPLNTKMDFYPAKEFIKKWDSSE